MYGFNSKKEIELRTLNEPAANACERVWLTLMPVILNVSGGHMASGHPSMNSHIKEGIVDDTTFVMREMEECLAEIVISATRYGH